MIKNKIYNMIKEDYKDQIFIAKKIDITSIDLFDENDIKLRSPQMILFRNNKVAVFIETTEHLQAVTMLGLILTQFLGKYITIHYREKNQEKYKIDSCSLLIVIPDQRSNSKKPIQMNYFEEKVKSLIDFREKTDINEFRICEEKNFKAVLKSLIQKKR